MKIEASRLFMHHPEYVAEVHDDFREYLLAQGYSSTEGKVTEGGLSRKRYESVGEGFTIQTTLRDKHDNTLTLRVNPKKCDLATKLKNGSLEESFPDFKFVKKQ